MLYIEFQINIVKHVILNMEEISSSFKKKKATSSWDFYNAKNLKIKKNEIINMQMYLDNHKIN